MAESLREEEHPQALLPVVERFVSINGEGLRAGQLAAFIRLRGCNLSCSYCDTRWANEPGCPVEMLAPSTLAAWVAQTGVACVTLTGGEPLLHQGTLTLAEELLAGPNASEGMRVEIETNGAVGLEDAATLRSALPAQAAERLAFTMDVKCPGSGCSTSLVASNFRLLGAQDAVKFVVGSQQDLEYAFKTVADQGLCQRCQVLFSPVFGCIEPSAIVEFMKDRQLTQARLQLQLHKFVWAPSERGV